MRSTMLVMAAVIALGSGLDRPASAQRPYPPVPPPQAEGPPPPPGPRFAARGYAWEPGHWQWNGTRYVWLGGRYAARREHRGGEFVRGHWAARRGAWVWVPAHWR